MNQFFVYLAAYAVIGFIFSLFLAAREEKKGGKFTMIILGAGLPGLVVLCLFWPLLPILSHLEQKTIQQEKNRKEKKPKNPIFPVGTRGITKTKMMPAGRIQIGDQLVDALSISGSLDTDVKVEVVGEDLNQPKIRKLELAETLKDESAPRH